MRTKCITNMSLQTEYKQTKIKAFRINLIQEKTLDKLKHKYNIDVSQFIRIAIKEKIVRDYPILQESIKIKDYPF